MRLFAIVTIARQVEGEIVSVRFEKAFDQASKADNYVKALAKSFTETIQVPDYGPIEFFCERGIHELEVE
jgi:hypothetical protein